MPAPAYLATAPTAVDTRITEPPAPRIEAKALVVYESMFGNTQTIARAIADGLATRLQVKVLPVGEAPAQIDSDLMLLAAGGPTHALGMSRISTRQDAVKQGGRPQGGADLGLREWLAALQPGSAPGAAVAFDTRVKKRGVPGSAARGAQKRLRRLAFELAAPARSFYVGGTSGPLLAEEEAQARRWGEQLASDLAQAQGRGVR